MTTARYLHSHSLTRRRTPTDTMRMYETRNRSRRRRRPKSIHVTDQTVQFVRDFGQILIRAATELEKFGEHFIMLMEHLIVLVKHFSMLAQHRGLAPLNLRNHNQIVLEFFDGFLIV